MTKMNINVEDQPRVEVAPGVFVSELSIERASSQRASCEHPREHNETWAHRRARLALRHEIKADVEIGRQIVKSQLKDVKPLREVHLDEVLYVMHTRNHQSEEDLPHRIQFGVPNISLPAAAETDPSDVKYELHTYVQLNALPPEVQEVVRQCISVSTGNTYSYKFLEASVEKLNQRVKEAKALDQG